MHLKGNVFFSRVLKVSIFKLAMLAAISMPAMAENVDLRVEGTIIPAACTPGISGDIDFGYITADKLSKTEFTVLEQKEFDFTIKCDAPVKVAIKALNGRPGSVAGAVESGPNSTAVSPVGLLGIDVITVAGLGTSGGKNIGGYAVAVINNTLMADGKELFFKIHSFADTWAAFPPGTVSPLYYLYYVPGGILTYSWGDSATIHTPIAITNLSAKFAVQAYLNNTTELDTNSAVQLDGMTTLELVYL